MIGQGSISFTTQQAPAGFINVAGANDGLSVTGGFIQLGQPIGAAGNPAQLIENREIPLNGNHLNINGSVFKTTFNPGVDDMISITGTNDSFLRIHMTNLAATASGGAGHLLQADSGNIGWLFYTSTVNAYVNNGFSIMSNGPGGLQLSASAGPLKFGAALGPPLSEYARFNMNGQLGLGLTVTSANLHIKASAGGVGQAPIKINAGPLLAVAEAGAIEFDSVTTGLFFSPAAASRQVVHTGNSGAAAPATSAAVALTNFFGAAGGGAVYLATPNSWAAVNFAGTTFKIPLYT